MTSTESTDPPAVQDELKASPEVHEAPTEPAAAEAKPLPTAEAPTSSPPAAAAPASSPPPSSSEMTATQVLETPPLPQRRSSQPAPTLSVDLNQPHQDPQVVSLQAIFPDFDVAILQSVLDSAGGNQDRAVDMLLGMNDPDYVPQEQPAPVQSQTDLDEEFARRLMLEEQQQQSWNPQPQGQQVAYQPRVRGRQQQQVGPGPQGGEQDTMGDFQEQFAKIADSGKKTFSSLLSRVKAKVQEFDQNRGGQSSAQAGTEPSWGSESIGGPPVSHSYYEEQQSHAQPSYYDPNPQQQEGGVALAHTPGYDATPYSYSESTSNPAAVTAPPPQRGALDGGSSSLPHAGTPPPPSTSSGAPPIDPSKLGMLPKRPVSLLRKASDPAPKPDDEDDELEYAENPFEEHK